MIRRLRPVLAVLALWFCGVLWSEGWGWCEPHADPTAGAEVQAGAIREHNIRILGSNFHVLESGASHGLTVLLLHYDWLIGTCRFLQTEECGKEQERSAEKTNHRNYSKDEFFGCKSTVLGRATSQQFGW